MLRPVPLLQHHISIVDTLPFTAFAVATVPGVAAASVVFINSIAVQLGSLVAILNVVAFGFLL